MNTFNQTYKELAIPYFKETFDCIDEVMRKLSIPYYLIGASAIALELLKQGIKPSRGTKDIDFAVMVSSIHEYSDIISALASKGFHKVSAPWTFYSAQFRVAIDVLPFGEIEENFTANFTERLTDLHVLGFREVMEDSVQVYIEEKIANIPPLPGMVILKLIAWSDRPEERENDLSDILKIIQHYFELAWDEIAEHHYDTFVNEPFDSKIIAAEVLGRNSRLYLKKSTAISERVMQVLAANLQDPSKSAIAREWARKLDTDIEYAFALLNAFQKGIINERLNSEQ
jgi:predicted nucleotidyltransferase